MAQFTFNLDQIKASTTKASTSFESSLYSKTKDEDLIYTGDDHIVWDRSNAERLRRGLPSLTDIGYPRPPEDPPTTGAAATNPDGTAKTFEINGPPGMTREQAFEIFKKQAGTGALVGFKPGETLSAATQAADGLASAQAMVSQAQSGVAGSLDVGGFTGSLTAAGVDLKTGRIPALDAAVAQGGIGAGLAAFGSIAPGIGAAGGAAGGSLAGITPGLTAAVGPAVSTVTTGFGGLISSVTGKGAPLVGAAGLQNSVAITSIQTINKAITQTPVANPISTTNFVKMAADPATKAAAAIGPMSVPEVTGVLAQAKNLVGQAFNQISDAKGLGAFGLNLAQLETAGYVKPGSRAKFDASSFTAVAKSPAIWTGKDGIKSAGDLLSNAPKQSQIQQDLMAKGVAGMAAVGIPVNNLSSQGIAGMALNAAKSLPNAEAFAKGLPIPGDATGELQAACTQAVRDGAFAVNLVNTKVPTQFKQQDIPVPASDTVSRATVDAASSRVIGDDKVPPPNYTASSVTPDEDALITEYANTATKFVNEYINVAGRALTTLQTVIEGLANQQTITQDQYDNVANELQTIRDAYNNGGPAAGAEVNRVYDKLPTKLRNAAEQTAIGRAKLVAKTTYVLDLAKQLKELLAQLKLKIAGTANA